jgi:hypothetical protein
MRFTLSLGWVAGCGWSCNISGYTDLVLFSQLLQGPASASDLRFGSVLSTLGSTRVPIPVVGCPIARAWAKPKEEPTARSWLPKDSDHADTCVSPQPLSYLQLLCPPTLSRMPSFQNCGELFNVLWAEAPPSCTLCWGCW